MKNNKRFIASIVELALGGGMLVGSALGLLDEFWSGMAIGLVVVAAINLIRNIRYHTNETYRESVDVERNDERNRYLTMKAWSWAGFYFVMIAAVCTILAKVAGYDELVPIASGSVCLILILYWVSYMFLRKKY